MCQTLYTCLTMHDTSTVCIKHKTHGTPCKWQSHAAAKPGSIAAASLPDSCTWSSRCHMPAVLAASPFLASAEPAARSWLQTACTRVRMHGFQGRTWLAATQSAAVAALSDCESDWSVVTALELKHAVLSRQVLVACDAACSINQTTVRQTVVPQPISQYTSEIITCSCLQELPTMECSQQEDAA